MMGKLKEFVMELDIKKAFEEALGYSYGYDCIYDVVSYGDGSGLSYVFNFQTDCSEFRIQCSADIGAVCQYGDGAGFDIDIFDTTLTKSEVKNFTNEQLWQMLIENL